MKTGQMINERYRIESYIGQGGNAEVYKVWDSQRGVYLAMKVLHRELAQNERFLRRFNREAQTLENLRHPNIVPFYGLEKSELMAFILMEFVEGASFEVDALDYSKGKLPIEQIMNIMRPVCTALNYAHVKNIAHCDIKPSNILVNRKGQVFVTDFGIARMMDQELEGHTRTVSGTPSYMAPEVISGGMPTPQTDIYALGIMLYEMVTRGHFPFVGQSSEAVGNKAQRILWEHLSVVPPSPREYNSQVTPEIEAVILKCLEKEPGNRYKSVLEFINALQMAVIKSEQMNEQVKEVIKGERVGLTNQIIAKIREEMAPTSVGGHTENGVSEKKGFEIKVSVPLMIVGFIGVIFIIATFLLLNQGNGLGSVEVAGDGNDTAGAQVSAEINPDMVTEIPAVQTTVPSVVQPISVSQFNKCEEVLVYSESKTKTEICITSVKVQPDGKMQFFFSWEVSSSDPNVGVAIYPDTGNTNMYLTDNLGNRLDHIETGGQANETVTLFDGDSKTGWFVFPSSHPDVKYFVFHDDDNGKQIAPIAKTW